MLPSLPPGRSVPACRRSRWTNGSSVGTACEVDSPAAEAGGWGARSLPLATEGLLWVAVSSELGRVDGLLAGGLASWGPPCLLCTPLPQQVAGLWEALAL